YLGDDITGMLSSEEYRIEKLFKELTNRSQNFDLIMVNTGVKTGNSTTPEMLFVKLHNKLLDAKKILEKKTCELSLEKKCQENSGIVSIPLESIPYFANTSLKLLYEENDASAFL